MTRYFLVLSLLAIAACKRPVSKQAEEKLVSGTILQTEAYCGGAAPSQQMLDELRMPKPLAGKTIYLKRGQENDPEAPVVASATSDQRGEFSLSLASGWYVVVDESKKDKASYNYMLANFAKESAQYSPVDRKCLDQWIGEADLVFEVADTDLSGVNITFHKPCSWNSFPCVRFIGKRPR